MRLFFAIIIALNSAFILTNGAEFSFLETTVKFPDTKEGVVLKHSFAFQNTGDEPLIVTNYKVACSCTKVQYPKKPIPPGGKGEITISFDTKGKYGFQKRRIELESNVKKKRLLTFKVFVIPDE